MTCSLGRPYVLSRLMSICQILELLRPASSRCFSASRGSGFDQTSSWHLSIAGAGPLQWHTRDTGQVRCSPDSGVHFGMNKLGLVNVYAKDIALLPAWQQRLWVGFNVGPEGGLPRMAMSTCLRCGGTTFETCDKEPRGSRYKLVFIQCSECGGVLGVLDFYNIGQLVHDLAKALGVKI